jgi:hypothetical protein
MLVFFIKKILAPESVLEPYFKKYYKNAQSSSQVMTGCDTGGVATQW